MGLVDTDSGNTPRVRDVGRHREQTQRTKDTESKKAEGGRKEEQEGIREAEIWAVGREKGLRPPKGLGVESGEL